MIKISKEKLEIEMAKKRINNSDLAKSANINYTTLTRIKSGKVCNTVTAGKIAAALGVDVTDIIELETKEGV